MGDFLTPTFRIEARISNDVSKNEQFNVEFSHGNWKTVWSITEDSRLKFEVFEYGACQFTFLSPRLVLSEEQDAIIFCSVNVSREDPAFTINGKLLDDVAYKEDQLVIESTEVGLYQGLSIFHKDAEFECVFELNSRSKMFVDYTSKTGRTKKNEQEVIQDLISSLEKLKFYQQEILSGQQFWISSLFAEIRALLYYKLDERGKLHKNHFPLLLYVAAVLDAALPVFARVSPANNLSYEQSVEEFQILAQTPYLHQNSSLETLCDLQDWISKPFVRIGNNEYTCIEFVCEIANTNGSAHYDLYKSNIVEVLKLVGDGESNYLFKVSIQMSKICIVMIEYLMQRAFEISNASKSR